MMLMLRYKPACVQQLFASSAEHGLSEAEAQDKWDGIAVSVREAEAGLEGRGARAAACCLQSALNCLNCRQ